MKVFLYARKSTDDNKHQVLSIDTQLFELRQLARQQNLTIVEEITEERTARMAGRPKFNNMLARLMRGEAQGILCWKLHRLARNFDDGGKIITLLQTGTIKGIHTLERLFSPQDNVLFLAFEFGIATQFSADLSKDVKLGLSTKLRAGGWPSLAPMGYLNDKSNNSVVVDPVQGPLVTEAFALFASGRYSMRELGHRMRVAGLVSSRGKKPIGTSSFDRLLRNPFYYGLMRYRGELAPGKHQPLISKEVFDRVQKLLSDRHRPRTKSLKPFLYRGLLRCGSCGCLITLEIQKGHSYVRCTKKSVRPCQEKYLRLEKLDAQVLKFLASLRVPASLPAAFSEVTRAAEEEAREKQQLLLQNLRGEDAALAAKADKLLSLFLAAGVSESEYLGKKNQIVLQRAELQDALRIEELRSNPLEPVHSFIQELTVTKPFL